MYKFVIGIFSLFLLVSCGSSEPATDADRETDYGPVTLIDIPDEVVDEYITESMSEYERMLFTYRSSLSDQYAETGVEIPELFMREVVYEERETDPYSGYRVQILSTRDIAEADSTRDNFIAWSDSVLTGYKPDAYVMFRSPSYRVRTGDFHNREQAIEFSRLLKTKYPDAWVVHDRIEPYRVPADTVEIRFRETEMTPIRR